MAKVHAKQRSYNWSNNYSKKGYSLLWKYLENTNDKLSKLKFVEDDSANESDVFTRNELTSPIKEIKLRHDSINEPETMKQACQNGNLARVRQLVESIHEDVNKPDEQNVYPLHWAAINNQIQVARYLLEKGAYVDCVGGDLDTTPLNWAVSGGHQEMVSFLVDNGANTMAFTNEGYAPIHIAAINGHVNIAAYFLAHGMNPNLLDHRNASPLILAARNSYSNAMSQIFITYNAAVNIQDDAGNTALHYCVEIDNWPILELLLKNGASADLKNNRGQTPIDTAFEFKNFEGAETIKTYVAESKLNKSVQGYVITVYSSLMILLVGLTLESSLAYTTKSIVLALAAATVPFTKKYFHGKRARIRMRFHGLLLFFVFCYSTWFVYVRPMMFGYNWYSYGVIVGTVFSYFYLYKSIFSDPGYLPCHSRDALRNERVLNLVHASHEFCSACIVRKPLRSKHCAICNRCVSKLDHHCPWVNNCIGEDNVKYFVLFIIWSQSIFLLYLIGVGNYYYRVCYADEITYSSVLMGAKTFLTCSPWLNMFTLPVLVHFGWMLCLTAITLYQLWYLGLTTNEKLNIEKYKCFKDKNGEFTNPYTFGVLQNIVDLLEINLLCIRPSGIRWKKMFSMDELENFKVKRLQMNKKFEI